MSYMKNLCFEIEDCLRRGFTPTEVATKFNISVEMVLQVEEDLMQLANPRFYGNDYE